jgi:hypothetical protein
MNYHRLDKLLAAQQWQEAAAETQRLVHQVSARNHQPPIGHDWLTSNGVNTFPCKDLQTIDRLWTTHSQGRYGFSTQANRWKGTLGFESLRQQPDRWRQYVKYLGWQAPRQRVEPASASTISMRGLPQAVQSTADFDDQPLTGDIPIFRGSAWLARTRECQL